jgi:hypothetical protein
MATESVAMARTNEPNPKRRSELEGNNWVCDFQTHRVLWEAQCICSLIDDAMDSGSFNSEVIQLAVQGVERLLAGAIARTGWTGIGWQDKD